MKPRRAPGTERASGGEDRGRVRGAGSNAKPAKPPPSLRAVAIRLLARREYSRAELAVRLARRGAERNEIERALDALEAAGYLSDTRFAQAIVHQRAGRYARRAIVHELREKGISGATAEAALAPLESGDELAEATQLWRRRFGVPPSDEREKGRQLRFLLSRGYPASIAFRVLRAAGARVDEDDTPD